MNDTNQTPKRIAIYIRVSTPDQGEKYGVDLQRAAVDALITSKRNTEQPYIFAGNEFVYMDIGISGTVELEERPAFAQLIEDIKHAPEGAKPFDAVAVYRIDRFARTLKVLLDILDFFKNNDLEFMSVTESIDTSTPFGRAMLSIIGVIAELERETIKERMGAGWVQAVKSGVHMGTSAPFGYEKDERKHLVLLNDEVKVIQLIFDLYVQQKKSVYEIADYLTKNQYLTPEASSIKYQKHKKKAKSKDPFRWHPENTRRILSDELYTGRAYYGKKKNGKKVPKSEQILVHVPVVINDVLFKKAQEIANSSKHGNKSASSSHLYLLTGLLRCDCCKVEQSLKHFVGTPQTVKSTGKRVYYYTCKGKNHLYKGRKCPTLPIGADAIEDYVVNLCKDLLSNPLHTYQYQQSLASTRLKIKHLRTEEEQLLKLINALPEKHERLRFQHSAGIIDNQKLKSDIEASMQSAKINRTKLAEVQLQISQCSLDEGYINTFQFFDKHYKQMLSDVGKNRAEAYHLIHTMIDQIIVYSRPVTDTDKVAGRQRGGQMITSRIHVKFRLPQDMLNEMGAQNKEKAPPTGASSSQKDVTSAR